MANSKKGFSYYSSDTDRYQDIRIKRLKKQCGCSGIAIYDYVLCEIYRVRGSYLEWDENSQFDVAEYMQVSEEFVSEVIDHCLGIGLFCKKVFDKQNVLTSKSIQLRCIDMSNRSKRKSNSIPEAIDLVSKIQEPVVKETKQVRSEEKPINVESGLLEEFELFRKKYPGSKRGLDTEFNNFKKKHKDYHEVVFDLNKAIDALMEWREAKKANGQFVPEYANLQTWINQRRWEVELEKITINGTDRINSESEQRRNHIATEAATISRDNA